MKAVNKKTFPEDWQTLRLAELKPVLVAGKSVNSLERKPKTTEKGILKTSCVSGLTFDPLASKAVLATEEHLLKTPVQRDTIVISRMNSPNLVGACGYCSAAFPSVFLPDRLWQMSFRKPEEICVMWLFHVLSSSTSQNWFSRIATGTSNSMKNITRDDVLSLIIGVPPLSERSKIAAILTAWDRGIGALTRLIEARTRQQRGWRQRLLTGESRFPEFGDTPWVECRLSDVVAATPRKVPKPDGPFLSAGLRSHGKGVFLKPSFEPGDIALEELFELRTDDLVVNITFAWEGAVAIVPPNADGALVSHRFPTFRFDGEQACPRYFAHLIRSKRFVAYCGLSSPGGAGRNRVLNVKSFLKMPLRIPSLPEQRRIAAALDAGEREIALLRRQLAALREQKRGLMQKLLTGEWRVKDGDSAKTSAPAPKRKACTSEKR